MDGQAGRDPCRQPPLPPRIAALARSCCCPRCPAPQYRMHPAIREFPSLNFYGGNLKDGPNVLQASAGSWGAALYQGGDPCAFPALPFLP